MRRRNLVLVSVFGHLALVLALYFGGVWRIDRLEAGKLRTAIADVPAHQEESGSPAPPAQPFQRKPPPPKRIADTPVQPTPRPVEPEPTPAVTGDDRDDNGNGKGTGTGSGPGTGPTPGDCVADCAPPKVTPPEPPQPPRPPDPPRVIDSTTLTHLRVSGETRIEPPDVIKLAMRRDGVDKATGTFKLCIDAAGAVTTVKSVKSTGYRDYDDALAAAIHGWRYRPFTVGGRAVQACSFVTFAFRME